jgi:hypothetical protein
VTGVARVAREKPGIAGKRGWHGAAPESEHLLPGDCWSPGRPGFAAASCAAAHRRGGPPPVRFPVQARAGNPPLRIPRAGERASRQRPRAPGRRGQPATTRKGQRLGTCVVRGEVRSPNHQRGMISVSRNRSRAPTAPLRDGLRPLLTEPVRPSVRVLTWYACGG